MPKRVPASAMSSRVEAELQPAVAEEIMKASGTVPQIVEHKDRTARVCIGRTPFSSSMSRMSLVFPFPTCGQSQRGAMTLKIQRSDICDISLAFCRLFFPSAVPVRLRLVYCIVQFDALKATSSCIFPVGYKAPGFEVINNVSALPGYSPALSAHDRHEANKMLLGLPCVDLAATTLIDPCRESVLGFQVSLCRRRDRLGRPQALLLPVQSAVDHPIENSRPLLGEFFKQIRVAIFFGDGHGEGD